MESIIEALFFIAVLIVSVIAHEISHGYMAERLGDPTARLAGRLTLNPIPHVDPFGSIFIPILLLLAKSPFLIGWAKPVPYNPNNMKNPRSGSALVALAGPVMNILIAVAFGFLVRFGDLLGLPFEFISIATLVVFLNLMLAVFNLIPLPPLDGSKILFALLPLRFWMVQEFLERYWFVTLPLLILFLWQLIFPIVIGAFRLLTGTAF